MDDWPYPQSLSQELELWQVSIIQYLQCYSTKNHSFSGPLLTNPIDPVQSCCLYKLVLSKVQFPNIYVWPLTSCEAERSLSGLRRLKNDMRSTMKEDCLKWLALMMVHLTIPVPVENIIDTFAAKHRSSKNEIGTYIRRNLLLCMLCNTFCLCVNVCVLLFLNSANRIGLQRGFMIVIQ